jgi:hypothetical protein
MTPTRGRIVEKENPRTGEFTPVAVPPFVLDLITGLALQKQVFWEEVR